jgi:hypothetical protein
MSPDVEEAAATARAFQRSSGATRVVLLLDRPDRAPVMIECTEQVAVTEGEDTTVVSPQAPPRPLHRLTPVPASAISLDPETGELSAPLGTIDHLARATLDLAKAFGGLTVATAEFATSDPELPITFAAREGEPVVLDAGDAQYEL